MNRMLKKKNAGVLLALIGGLVVLVATTQGCGRNTGALPAGYSPEGNNSLETVIFVELDKISAVTGLNPAHRLTQRLRTSANRCIIKALANPGACPRHQIAILMLKPLGKFQKP